MSAKLTKFAVYVEGEQKGFIWNWTRKSAKFQAKRVYGASAKVGLPRQGTDLREAPEAPHPHA